MYLNQITDYRLFLFFPNSLLNKNMYLQMVIRFYGECRYFFNLFLSLFSSHFTFIYLYTYLYISF